MYKSKVKVLIFLSLSLLIAAIFIDNTMSQTNNNQKATFGAGCFWGVESTFMEYEGVVKTEVGYMGGSLDDPTYKDVCTDQTGHAEVVQIEFDPTVISYNQLLEIFWSSHNPTTLNRQGPDFGKQYRSVIFYYNDVQKQEAEKMMSELENSGTFKDPIVTQIIPAETFWKAEEYHQKYYHKKGIKKACNL